MKDILKIIKSLEDSGLLLGVSETIKNEAKGQKGEFLSMLLGTLCVSLLGNMLSGKRVISAGEGTARVGYGSKKSSHKKFFYSTHPLTNFDIKMYYQNEPRFNRVYNIDEYMQLILMSILILKLIE